MNPVLPRVRVDVLGRAQLEAERRSGAALVECHQVGVVDLRHLAANRRQLAVLQIDLDVVECLGEELVAHVAGGVLRVSAQPLASHLACEVVDDVVLLLLQAECEADLPDLLRRVLDREVVLRLAAVLLPQREVNRLAVLLRHVHRDALVLNLRRGLVVPADDAVLLRDRVQVGRVLLERRNVLVVLVDVAVLALARLHRDAAIESHADDVLAAEARGLGCALLVDLHVARRVVAGRVDLRYLQPHNATVAVFVGDRDGEVLVDPVARVTVALCLLVQLAVDVRPSRRPDRHRVEDLREERRHELTLAAATPGAGCVDAAAPQDVEVLRLVQSHGGRRHQVDHERLNDAGELLLACRRRGVELVDPRRVGVLRLQELQRLDRETAATELLKYGEILLRQLARELAEPLVRADLRGSVLVRVLRRPPSVELDEVVLEVDTRERECETVVVEVFAPRVLAVSAPCVSVVVDADVLEQLELGQFQLVRDGPDHVLHAAAFEDLLVVELAEGHRHEDLVAVAALDDTTDVAVVDGRGLFLLGLVDRDATTLAVGALRLQRLLELVAGRSLVTVPVQQDVDTGGAAADERHQVAGAVVPEREGGALVAVDPALDEPVVRLAERDGLFTLHPGLLLQELVGQVADVRLDSVDRRAVGRRGEVPERLRRQQICGDHDLAAEVLFTEERSHALRGVLVGRSLEVGCDHDSAGEVEAAHLEQRAAAGTDVLELRVLLNGLEQVARAGCGLVGVLLSEVVGEDLAVLELTLRYEHDRDAAVHQLVEAELRAGVVAAERVDGEEHHVVARRAGRRSGRALQHRAGQDAKTLLL